jgi:hypothetical protein
MAREQFREFSLIAGKRVQAKDAILQEGGVQLAGAVQANEQRWRIVGHRAGGGSCETCPPGRAVGRHNVHGAGEASHTIAVKLL